MGNIIRNKLVEKRFVCMLNYILRSFQPPREQSCGAEWTEGGDGGGRGGEETLISSMDWEIRTEIIVQCFFTRYDLKDKRSKVGSGGSQIPILALMSSSRLPDDLAGFFFHSSSNISSGELSSTGLDCGSLHDDIGITHQSIYRRIYFRVNFTSFFVYVCVFFFYCFLALVYALVKFTEQRTTALDDITFSFDAAVCEIKRTSDDTTDQ